MGTKHGNLHLAGWPILFCRPTGKNWERFWKKNAGEWAGRVEISKEELPGSKRSIYGIKSRGKPNTNEMRIT